MIRKLLDRLATRLPDPAPIDTVDQAETALPSPIKLSEPIKLSDETIAEAAALIAEPGAFIVVPTPSESEIIAAWLTKVRDEYQPWARRYAHQLIDELIERAEI